MWIHVAKVAEELFDTSSSGVSNNVNNINQDQDDSNSTTRTVTDTASSSSRNFGLRSSLQLSFFAMNIDDTDQDCAMT